MRSIYAFFPFLLVAISTFIHSSERFLELFGVAVFCLILQVARRWDDDIAEWRQLKWLSMIGVISYSLYLIHAPIGQRVLGLGLRWIPHESF